MFQNAPTTHICAASLTLSHPSKTATRPHTLPRKYPLRLSSVSVLACCCVKMTQASPRLSYRRSLFERGAFLFCVGWSQCRSTVPTYVHVCNYNIHALAINPRAHSLSHCRALYVHISTSRKHVTEANLTTLNSGLRCSN